MSIVQAAANKDDYRRPKAIPHPSDNPYSQDKATLGRKLFFDPRLSGSNWISCATCHNPAFSWGEGLPLGIGHGMHQLERRTPTLLNLAWGELMFWDGRASSLEEQALLPVIAAGEMNLPADKLVEKLKGIPGYQVLFAKVFPGEGLNQVTVSKAIATYERTIVSGEAPFDRWIEGDEKAISESAKRGFAIFNGKALCSKCHSGWRFTDEGFYDIGLKSRDLGRGKVLPEIDSLKNAFKTPTLRNATHRSPYMHDGSEATLEQVVDFYNRGGDAKRPNQASDVRPLGLSPLEKTQLLDFMKTLTSQDPETTVDMLPR